MKPHWEVDMAVQSNTGETMLAFFLGAIAGALAGILLAPCSGRETRKRMGDWFEDNREKAREFLAKEREVIKEKKDQLASAWDAGKKAYREAGPGHSAS
jgi:gas vesicle protein